MCIDEFNGDNFDHGPLGFFGGGYLGQVQTNGRPMEDGRGAARHAHLVRTMEASRDNCLSTVYSGAGVHVSCSTPPRRGHDEER